MGKHTDKDQHYHNKAEQDYAADKQNYDPPHGIISSSNSWKNVEETEAYKKGWENARSQDPDKIGCFLTTACVEHAGLTDDCRELRTLRAFRDTYVAALPNGEVILAEYYAVAPRIVEGIKKSLQREEELSAILTMVRDAIYLIENKQFQTALSLYEAMYADLKQRYAV